MPSEADPQVLAQMVQAAQGNRWPILLAGRSGVGLICSAGSTMVEPPCASISWHR